VCDLIWIVYNDDVCTLAGGNAAHGRSQGPACFIVTDLSTSRKFHLEDIAPRSLEPRIIYESEFPDIVPVGEKSGIRGIHKSHMRLSSRAPTEDREINRTGQAF